MFHNHNQSSLLPAAALLVGASIWGIIWYPIRLLEQAGISGAISTTITYFIALLIGLILFRKELRYDTICNRDAHLLFWICFFAGWTNIAYILAVILGEIVRVLLLFYLSPLWTILFSRLLLNERLSLRGYGIMALSFIGAVIMLWHPETHFPLPKSYGDWLGLAGGIMFALVNVLIRKDQSHSIELKSIAIWFGATIIGLGCSFFFVDSPDIIDIALKHWELLLSIGIAMFLLSLMVQYGLTYTPANRAIILLMFELVVAAVAAYFLANETISWRELVGGSMIIAASLFSVSLKTSSSCPLS